VIPNPSLAGATSTQAAKLSATVSIPLIVLGQRGAAIAAARADESTARLDTELAWIDVRQATIRAFVELWLAEGAAAARRDSAKIAAALENAVVQRVEVGSAPQLDALRVHAERLRADADVLDAAAHVIAAASELGRWMGLTQSEGLRAKDAVAVAAEPPPLSSLLARIESSSWVRREQADARAADARVSRERAFVRPSMGIDVGLDAFDPTLLGPNAPPGAEPPINYRAQLTFDVPLFNQRGPYIDRERAQGDVARAHIVAARLQTIAELSSAYRTFEAATARQRTLAESVVPAAQGAAKATEEAYSLGRAQLLAVLDAERTLVDARVAALVAQATQASSWADVEHALGVQ
jgi:cobalt-zinc-cadmium efflux system outer membrane protein